MKRLFRILVIGSLAALTSFSIWAQPATRLKPKTVEQFQAYIDGVEKDFETVTSKTGPAFWFGRLRSSVRQEIMNGKISIERNEKTPSISNGIIHDWSGAIFIPNVQARDVLELLTDYDRHQEIYDEVIESKTLAKSDDFAEGRLLLKKEKVLTVVLNTEHRAEFRRLGQKEWRIQSRSTRIAEVRDFGSVEQKELPVGRDSGFLWRLNAYWGIFGEKEGVIVACTTVSLSRDIPWGLGWVIGPFVESMPRETLEDTLLATRFALVKTSDRSGY